MLLFHIYRNDIFHQALEFILRDKFYLFVKITFDPIMKNLLFILAFDQMVAEEECVEE